MVNIKKYQYRQNNWVKEEHLAIEYQMLFKETIKQNSKEENDPKIRITS